MKYEVDAYDDEYGKKYIYILLVFNKGKKLLIKIKNNRKRISF